MSNKILEKIHKSVTNAYEKGIVNLSTMQKFDELCMVDSNFMRPEEIGEDNLPTSTYSE